jgi:hypothetical protein
MQVADKLKSGLHLKPRQVPSFFYATSHLDVVLGVSNSAHLPASDYRSYH